MVVHYLRAQLHAESAVGERHGEGSCGRVGADVGHGEDLVVFGETAVLGLIERATQLLLQHVADECLGQLRVEDQLFSAGVVKVEDEAGRIDRGGRVAHDLVSIRYECRRHVDVDVLEFPAGEAEQDGGGAEVDGGIFAHVGALRDRIADASPDLLRNEPADGDFREEQQDDEAGDNA